MAVPAFPFADGARGYQIDALNTWKENGCQGFFAMATGTGKTVTALNCLLDSYMEKGRYRCLILVPTISLVDQWQKECRRFNFNNIVRISSKESHWKDDITRITASALFNQSASYVIIVTYASLVKKEVVSWIDELPNDTLVNADDDTFKAVPETPFWHMNSEPFWTLQRSDGGDIFDIKNSPTSGQLKGYKIYAEISPEIYKLMTSENNRIKLRQVLCDEYLNVQ